MKTAAAKAKFAGPSVWAVRPGDRPHLCGAVKIGGHWYFVEPVVEDEFSDRPVLAGYRFVNLEKGTVSDVDVSRAWLTCSCPHWVWRCERSGKDCKHTSAIKELACDLL